MTKTIQMQHCLANMTPAYLATKDEKLRKRMAIEVALAKKLVRTLLTKGFKISVDDGEHKTAYMTNETKIFKAMWTTDEECLDVELTSKVVLIKGWIKLMYGESGWDLISDYTVNLEYIIQPIQEFAETFIN